MTVLIARLIRYEIRKEENKRFAAKLGIDFVDVDGDVDEWYRRAKGMEFFPERGTRCSMCFDMRLERTALYAHEHGFDSFTTTNATSRWKDEKQVNDSGLKAAAKYEGVEYWVSDWQTAEMTQRKYDEEGSRARRASPIATDGLSGRPTDDLWIACLLRYRIN